MVAGGIKREIYSTVRKAMLVCASEPQVASRHLMLALGA